MKQHLPGNNVLGLKQGIILLFPWKINKNQSSWKQESVAIYEFSH